MCFQSNDIVFLTEEQVLKIHDLCLSEFGGKEGFANEHMFYSALYQPQTSFGGEYLYKTIYEMAAAYLISFSKGHCFMDGNKRTGLKNLFDIFRNE